MSFFSLFEKPKQVTAFSLDDKTLRYVSVDRTKEGVDVTDYGTHELPLGVIDSHGDITDDGAFVAQLKAIIKNIDFKGTVPEAVMVVPDRQSVMFHTHITKEEPRAMNDIITDHITTYCQAHELLEFSEYVCEYDVIEETQFGYDVHVTLVPKQKILHLIDLFKQAGVIITHIETAHHSVARACLDIPRGMGVVLVNIGEKSTQISVLHGNHAVTQDEVMVGRENISSTIQRFLDVDRNYAEKIIARHGILKTHPDNGLLGELYLELAPIYRSIDRQLIALGQIPYKTSAYRFATGTLVVYGVGVGIKGMASFLEEKTGLSVKELDVWSGLPDRALVPSLHAEEVLLYAEPLALALLYLN